MWEMLSLQIELNWRPLPGYETIQGNVFINPLMVTDLEPLSSLQRIEVLWMLLTTEFKFSH